MIGSVDKLALTGDKRNAYRILVGKSEENRPLRRPRHRWEDNIKMDAKNRTGGRDCFNPLKMKRICFI
jgi:hypothetical protein